MKVEGGKEGGEKVGIVGKDMRTEVYIRMPSKENHLTCWFLPPVSDVINQVLFEHEAPSLDDVEQGLLEGSCIHTEPHI